MENVTLKESVIKILLNLSIDMKREGLQAIASTDNAYVVFWRKDSSRKLFIKENEGKWKASIEHGKLVYELDAYSNITDMLFSPHNILWYIQRQLLYTDV